MRAIFLRAKMSHLTRLICHTRFASQIALWKHTWGRPCAGNSVREFSQQLLERILRCTQNLHQNWLSARDAFGGSLYAKAHVDTWRWKVGYVVLSVLTIIGIIIYLIIKRVARKQEAAAPIGVAQNFINMLVIPTSDISICLREDGSEWNIGDGWTGEVYKGKMYGVLDVAVKCLSIMRELSLEQFMYEIENLWIFSLGDNIVQFRGCVIDSEAPALIWELMEGGDLRAALAGPQAEYLKWYEHGQVLARDIVSGLFFLHCPLPDRWPLIHGDLNSRNILLSRNRQTAKLCDVGFSRVLHRALASDEQFPEFPGAFAYMAPELELGQAYTEKADIYSLGVVLWEICTHEIPKGRHLRPLHVPEECPQAISDLIEQCMQREPNERPTAEAVYRALIEESAATCLADNHSSAPSKVLRS